MEPQYSNTITASFQKKKKKRNNHCSLCVSKCEKNQSVLLCVIFYIIFVLFVSHDS